MGAKSKIEWTNRTWNPVTGCTKVSQGCKHCYAEREWARLSANPKSVYYGRKFTDVMVHPERINEPLHWRKPSLVFVNSMSDLFHPDVSHIVLNQILNVIDQCPQHVFQVLTKRPERALPLLKHWCDSWECTLPSNLWLGVSIEDQATADERIPILVQIPAAVRFVSAEPLLGMVDLSAIPIGDEMWDVYGAISRFFHWLIVGGESGPDARPMHPDWVRRLRDQAIWADVPFFFKQWGEWAPTSAKPIRGEYTGGGIFLHSNGKYGCQGDWWDGKAEALDRLGKKKAGRLLDGREWNEYPAGWKGAEA